MTSERDDDLNRDDALDDLALDALFAETRQDEPEGLSSAFAARLMQDAVAHMPTRDAQPGFLSKIRDWLSDLGGVPGLAGMGVAGVAGVWIGFSGPGVTGDLVNQFWQGAASVSPSVSNWVGSDFLTDGTTDLLSLMSGEIQ